MIIELELNILGGTMIQTTQEKPLSLLKPTQNIQKKPIVLETTKDIFPYLNQLRPSSKVAVDFETTGLDVLDPDFKPVGVGIACDKFPEGIYAPLGCDYDSTTLMSYLTNFKLIAHNVSYDARVMELVLRKSSLEYKPMSNWPWVEDTYLIFKSLSTEGYLNQSWSLKEAQKIILGWKETNEIELDNWLIENNYSRGGRPDKGQMWKAPNDILGKYCALDAQSTWALHKHFESYLTEFPDLDLIIKQEFITLSKLEVEQFFYGIKIDTELLEARMNSLQDAMDKLLNKFYNDSEVSHFIQTFNWQQVNDIIQNEPPKYTKTNKITSRWKKWQDKVEVAKTTNYFNPNSKPHLCWLFYDVLYESSPVVSSLNWRKEEERKFSVKVDGKIHWIEATATGRKRIDKKILPKLGIAGKLLSRYNELNKLMGYMKKMKESTRSSIHHTNLRIYGTLTGRCSGSGGVNIQQLPKARDYLDCFIPRPGNVFIQMDVDALEPVVLAELSEDPAMMKLYGPGAKPNDIYLFVGASIPALRSKICMHGYDPQNPTKEAISRTKKLAKTPRTICKIVHLSASYGAGPGTIYQTLQEAGVKITKEEVKTIHSDYWKLFKGVTSFQNDLKTEWSSNGGWFLNGRGMPTAVANKYEKDILNRCIQSTGHVNLLTYLKNLDLLRSESDISLRPVLVDFHDETVWEVPENQAEKALELFNKTWDLTNKELGGIISLSGAPEICKTFSDFKCEGGYRTQESLEEFNLDKPAKGSQKWTMILY